MQKLSALISLLKVVVAKFYSKIFAYQIKVNTNLIYLYL